MNRSLSALAALLLICAVLAAPAPKPSQPSWDKPVDPDKDCKISRGKDSLTIEMPGTVHDYVYNRDRKCLNAPRLMCDREFEGDFALQVRTRIDCRASVESSVKGQSSYVSAGFLVLSPDKPYSVLRAEYRVEGQGDGIDGWVGYESLGLSGGVPVKQHPRWPLTTKPQYVYQRLERCGNSLNHSFSSDGEKWIPMGGSNWVEMPSKLRVGLLACSTSTDPSKVGFDQLTSLPLNKKRVPWGFMSGWGMPMDPDKDCKIQREKDYLTIEIPGSDHDYDPIRKRVNAPRLISDLEGRFDLQVRVRIDCRLSDESTVEGQPAFVSAGFLLIYPDDAKFPDGWDICARLEYAESQEGSKPGGSAIRKQWLATLQENGNSQKWDHGMPKQGINKKWNRGWQSWPLAENAEYAYLRLYHREWGAAFYISPDGERWTLLTSLRSLPERGKLALAAYSTSTEPSTVRFDQLKLARYK